MSITRLSPPRLRTVAEAEHRSATWLELFYDLAFVVSVAILADRLHQEVGLIGLLSYFAYFGLLWWLWVSHTYYADRYDTDDLVYRLLAAGQMLAIVVIGAALTTGDANSTRAFAIAFAAARVLLLLMYLRAFLHVRETRALVGGYLRGFGLGAVVWISSAVGPDDARVVLWAVALTIDLATPWVLRREQARVPLDVSHLPERFGLFTILVLGESIAAVVAGLGHTSWSVLPTVTSALAIGIATTLWWMYFDNVSGSVVRRRPDTGPTWRPTVWLYSHLPLAAALAATGVALEVAVSEAGRQLMSGAGRWLLVGSISAVLASLAVIEFATTDRSWLESRSIVLGRVAGIPLLVFLGLMSAVEPVWVVSGVLVVCVGQLVCDMFLGGVQVNREAA